MRLRSLAFALLLGSAAAEAAHPLSNAKVYVTRDGWRAVTASAGGERCVVMVSGPQGPLEGLVLDCRAVREDDRTNYFVIIRGREELALRTEGTGRASLSRTQGQFEYSDAESKKEDLAALWATHQAQEAAGKLAAVSGFDRPKETAALAREVADAVEPLNRACATKLTFTLDLAVAPDEVISAGRPHRGCLEAIEVMKDLCRWKAARAAFAEKLGEVRCTFGASSEPRFTLTGKSLVVTSTHETVSLPGSLDRYLKEAL